MKQAICSAVIILLFISCNNNESKSTDEPKDDINRKQEFYQNQMKIKNFQFENDGTCDDALEDTIHEMYIPYIESKILTDSTAIIEFKFIDDCCQYFLGDYSIINDTLLFAYENVGDPACFCICWYRYKLTINEPKENYNEIIIQAK